jgi:hypothetical protein
MTNVASSPKLSLALPRFADMQISDNGNKLTFPQKVDSLSSAYQSCLTYSVSGQGQYSGSTFKGSCLLANLQGKDGTGSLCTCDQWNSATGCNGVTKAQTLSSAQSTWTTFFTSSGSGSAQATDFACCSTDLCNSGLGITFSAGSLPVVNVLALLATALLGCVLTSNLL